VLITPLLPEPLIFMAGIVVVLVGTTVQGTDAESDQVAEPTTTM
jgi:hypothetical protein